MCHILQNMLVKACGDTADNHVISESFTITGSDLQQPETKGKVWETVEMEKIEDALLRPRVKGHDEKDVFSTHINP